MKKATEKLNFFARYSKIQPAVVEPEELVVSPATEKPPAGERLYFWGVPRGLTDTQKLVLRGMDRIGQPMIRAEMVRRFSISAETLNLALVALEQQKLVERSLYNGRFRYALCEPPADCVLARSAHQADAMECLSGQELVNELAHKPSPVVDAPTKWRLENERKAKADRANQAIVLDAIRRAQAISGIAELRPFLPSDHPQLTDHAARKAIKQLLDEGTITERRIRLTPRRLAAIYTLADASNDNATGDFASATQASGTADQA